MGKPIGENIFGLQTRTKVNIELEPPKKSLIDVRKLLLEEKSEDVVRKAISIALNDDHSAQPAMIKLILDRMLPMSEFEKEGKSGVDTVIIDRSCGGRVTIKTNRGSVEIDEETYLGSPDTFENGE